MPGQLDCAKHGRQQFALACIHVAIAVDSKEQLGFYWGDQINMGRPDAWCDGVYNSSRTASSSFTMGRSLSMSLPASTMSFRFAHRMNRSGLGGFIRPRPPKSNVAIVSFIMTTLTLHFNM